MIGSKQSNLVRGLIAAALLAVLAAVVGSSLVPELPVATVVLYAVGGGSILFAIVLAATVASLQFGQFVIRKGGTDPQWFWFSSEPAGLVRLRGEARNRTRDEALHDKSSNDTRASRADGDA